MKRTEVCIASEKAFHLWLSQRVDWVSLDQNRPDFWDGKRFVEIKLGTTLAEPELSFIYRSKYFKYILFNTRVDRQIERYPKPLLVIVYDALYYPPQEITRRLFDSKPETSIERFSEQSEAEREERRKYIAWKKEYVKKRRKERKIAEQIWEENTQFWLEG